MPFQYDLEKDDCWSIRLTFQSGVQVAWTSTNPLGNVLPSAKRRGFISYSKQLNQSCIPFRQKHSICHIPAWKPEIRSFSVAFSEAFCDYFIRNLWEKNSNRMVMFTVFLHIIYKHIFCIWTFKNSSSWQRYCKVGQCNRKIKRLFDWILLGIKQLYLSNKQLSSTKSPQHCNLQRNFWISLFLPAASEADTTAVLSNRQSSILRWFVITIYQSYS